MAGKYEKEFRGLVRGCGDIGTLELAELMGREADNKIRELQNALGDLMREHEVPYSDYYKSLLEDHN